MILEIGCSSGFMLRLMRERLPHALWWVRIMCMDHWSGWQWICQMDCDTNAVLSEDLTPFVTIT